MSNKTITQTLERNTKYNIFCELPLKLITSDLLNGYMSEYEYMDTSLEAGGEIIGKLFCKHENALCDIVTSTPTNNRSKH